MSSTDLARSTVTSPCIRRHISTVRKALALSCTSIESLSFTVCNERLFVKIGQGSAKMEKKRSSSGALPDTVFTISRWKLWIFWCSLFCSTPDHLQNAVMPKSHVWQILTSWPFSHGPAQLLKVNVCFDSRCPAPCDVEWGEGKTRIIDVQGVALKTKKKQKF